MTKQQYYDAVAKELEQQHLDRGLWARAFAETNGDKERARALYIRLRVAQLEQDAQTTSSVTKPKKDILLNILLVLLSSVGLSVMILVVKECNRPPKVEHVGGFMNVGWGTSPEEAKRIISQRDGVVFNFDDSSRTGRQLYFSGGTFSDLEVDTIDLDFLNDLFYRGWVRLKPHPTLLDTWKDLTTGFTKKYGSPSLRDDNMLSARWRFSKHEVSRETIECFKDDKHGNIVVVYENTTLAEVFGAK